ncbi:Lysine exporter protein (LYSE/YGGA) [Emticicia oligotrophica DSM 17448]|uniref:Lysine exporter protein (LYSE/YGGA) n=1 Tax=Emticicia oligotrophica (strain DSM 17448 / CIP 109782 / MTCC 6937 / GPTSA100-15) TaxID=929562 RepID=A0ABM5N2A4_EMTOG|nr:MULTISPECIES: LysE family translocator [Emticicia]AFK03570.1 Lysine exporter protein (LYSE/YGGA) [Emticicia oligotrophica DSM 17448]
MLDLQHFILFVLAALMLNITPGNDMIFVISRSLSYGTRAGVYAALGIALGCFVHTFAAAAGLSVIIQQSEVLFNIIRYAGAGYLIYIGIKSFMEKPTAMVFSQSDNNKNTNLKILRQGTITNVLNPKVSLFFLAFLPQFINPQVENVSTQILLLGLWFNFSGTVVNILIAILFSKVIAKLKNFQRFWQIQNKISGAVLVGLGLQIALKK